MAVLKHSGVLARSAAASAFLCLVCARPLAQAPGAQPTPTAESDIKAAFLFNFTKFVDWPATAFEGTPNVFRVCVFAEPSFVRSVQRMLQGETVRGRPLQVETPYSAERARTCHIAYFAQSSVDHAAGLLPALRQEPVLTVGESKRFLTQGGALAFVLDDNRVRFDINKKAADQAGLTISSKLLRVARNVSPP
ncbi:MAG: YfiR family protein [Acidobacteria bacterium]|nr:YfiR family protein [Acidobacteriota bacterium]MCA1649314.1 YfiR family protein [Acidobacteriota bacterium]